MMVMMNDIFKNAKFGDIFKTRDGRKAIYHYSESKECSNGEYWKYHYLIVEPILSHSVMGKEFVYAPYDSYVNKDGVGVLSGLKYCERRGVNKNEDIIEKVEIC